MSTDRKLIRGGHVVTADAKLGVIPNGEVLVEDGVITAVGANLGVSDAEIIDAEGGIIAPGTIDTHRHTWQAQLRGCCCDTSLQQYISGFWADATPSYTAEDAKLGTLVGALEALDGGVTTLLDYAHITNSPEHADAAVDGLEEAGIRAVFAYGLGQANIMAPPEFDRMADLARIASERFSGSGLLTLGAALSEIGLSPISVNKKQKQLADDLGAVSTVHIGTSWSLPPGLAELFHAGVLDSRLVLAHANTFAETDWKLAAEAGVKVSTTPESELAMGAGKLAINSVLRHGLKPTIGADVVSLNSGDIITPTRQALAYTRWADAVGTNEQGGDIYVVSRTAHEALEWATINGADALGLADRVGSLTPGKQADLIVVGGRHIGIRPVNDPVGQLIFHTSPGLIDTVLVAGKVVKRNGQLVGVDLPALLAKTDDSAKAIKERMARIAAEKTPMSPEVMANFPKWIAHNLAS
ncbi:amidohydrolase family protein [Rhodococcus sp. T2V]|uniref:amidohydrolase family protein n=1 Tax=Rhodococcus sp. T2V TaxID=3034164 RepID=UPI0023E10D69|nr:amidohydrolase family protein [Rhodococcus sp. T2V]MDF3305334.1 amidohydrolase family protein [Rhodococcus sp. T2V]